MASVFIILASLAFFGGGFCGCSNEAAKAGRAAFRGRAGGRPGARSSTGDVSASRQALEQAKGASLPVLLNFHSTQCAPCIEIEKVIKEVEPEYAGRVAFIIVDVYDQSESDLCNQYGIQTIPTTFFLDAQGQTHGGIRGSHRCGLHAPDTRPPRRRATRIA